jgi:hypothetical protein
LKLQALLCSLTAGYGMRRRFELGKGIADVVVRLLEPLLVQTMMNRVNGTYTKAEILDSLWWAVDQITGRWDRAVDPDRKVRWLDRADVVFHRRGREPIAVRITPEGSVETLSVERLGSPRRSHRRRIHIDLARIAGLVDRLDLRRLVHDILAWHWNRKAFRLSWMPGFARELAKLGVAAAGMAAFHLRTAIGWRFRRRGVR